MRSALPVAFDRVMHGLRAGLFLILLAAGARAVEPAKVPILRIDAGMHTAFIAQADADASGRWAVTGSDDKTVRVWDVASGKLLKTLRPPIGSGHEGKMFAVAISPDAAVVAASGITIDDSVYLFDRSSGRLLRRLEGIGKLASVNRLTFSPNGRWLAAVLWSKGVRVWDLRDPSAAVLQDAAYGDQSYGAAWSGNDRLATGSYDGKIRLYRVGSGSLVKLREYKAECSRPHGVDFSPDGTRLALGCDDKPRVDVLDGSSLARLFSADVTGVSDSASSVAWSRDGQTLAAGGLWGIGNARMVRLWGNGGRGQPKDVATLNLGVRSISGLPGGGWLVAGNDPAWGVLGEDGRWRPGAGPPIADLRGSVGNAFMLDEAGTRVQFGFEYGGKAPHTFDLAHRQLGVGPLVNGVGVRTTGVNVQNWQDSVAPTLDGKPIATLTAYEQSRSFAATPDASGFVLGCDWSLRSFAANGEQQWKIDVPGVVWGVNIPPRGRVIVAAHGDGTIRWYRLKDGQELLALYVHPDRKRWVVWTPSGYYDAAPASEGLIGWHVSRGADQAADFFPASRFRDTYYRPDVIDHVLETLDETLALQAADNARGHASPQRASITQTLPPVVELVSPAAVSTDQGQTTLRFHLRSAADAPVTAIFARVDGLAQPVQRNLEAQPANGDRLLPVSLPPHDSHLQLFAENRFGLSTPVDVQVKWTGRVPAAGAGDVTLPRLFVLAVGVGQKYRKIDKPLKFPAKDAADFAAAVRLQQGLAYSEVNVRLLTEEQATRGGIIDAMEWLKQSVTQHDVGMLFMSAHGITDIDNNYFFVPVDADPEHLRSTTVSMADIGATYARRPGHWVVFIDTCHAGGMGNAARKGVNDVTAAIDQLAAGAIVYSSSTTGQFSLEDDKWKNGAFTKALVEGLQGSSVDGGRLAKGSPVTYKSLDLYVTRRTQALTAGAQTPVTINPDGLPDFTLAYVK